MQTGKQKQMNDSYQASLVNRHIRRFIGTVIVVFRVSDFLNTSVTEFQIFFKSEGVLRWSILSLNDSVTRVRVIIMQTRKWCQSARLAETYRLICNLNYLNKNNISRFGKSF